MMHGVVNCCGYVCCSRWRCVYRYCMLQLAIMMFRDMYGSCCRWLNVFLFEVIDCCMSESGDVIIDELDTLSLLDISSFQWFIDAAAYQLTCCSLSNGSRSTKWLMTPRWRPMSTKCVCGCVHGRRRKFICTASLSPDSSCSVRWYRLPKTLSNFNVCGGEGAYYVMTDKSRMEWHSILTYLELWLFCR